MRHKNLNQLIHPTLVWLLQKAHWEIARSQVLEINSHSFKTTPTSPFISSRSFTDSRRTQISWKSQTNIWFLCKFIGVLRCTSSGTFNRQLLPGQSHAMNRRLTSANFCEYRSAFPPSSSSLLFTYVSRPGIVWRSRYSFSNQSSTHGVQSLCTSMPLRYLEKV